MPLSRHGATGIIHLECSLSVAMALLVLSTCILPLSRHAVTGIIHLECSLCRHGVTGVTMALLALPWRYWRYPPLRMTLRHQQVSGSGFLIRSYIIARIRMGVTAL